MPENRGCGCGCGSFGFGGDCIWIIIVLILIYFYFQQMLTYSALNKLKECAPEETNKCAGTFA